MQLKAERLNRLRFCFISTAIIAFICHGYRYFNLSYSGDATLIYQTGEELYQISLGRFLQPLWGIYVTVKPSALTAASFSDIL